MKAFLKERFALTTQGANDLLKASVATFFTFLLNMVPAMLLMLFFNELILSNVTRTTLYYTFSIGIVVGMYIVLTIEYNVLYTTTYKESENLRVDIARELSNLPLSYFSKHDLTDLAQTIMGDVAALEHALSHAIAKLIGFIAFFVIITILLLFGNVALGLCVILPILLYFGAILISEKMNVASNTKYYHKLRANADEFQETLELQQEIKSYGMSEEVRDKLYHEVEEGENIHIRAEFSSAIICSISSLILYLALILVIVIGIHLLITEKINILYFLGYLLAAMKIKDATEGIGMNMMELYYIDAMIERIKEIRNTKRQEGWDTNIANYDIEFKHVAFSYNEKTPVLNDVSFVAKQNEVTALVGKSGCGKTSILRLVSRLYDAKTGTITISGKDINAISTKSLFEKISIVFQDVSLFHTSIMENIRIGKLDATDEEVKNAARLANCEQFIEKLENGYETLIGENGSSLSGGERQRLSIARAFLKNAPILILDEIAASLDVDNEKKIQDSLNTLTKNKTVLIISHRLKSIENVDNIIVIDDGKVEGAGRHEDLMKSSIVYSNLVKKTRLVEKFEY